MKPLTIRLTQIAVALLFMCNVVLAQTSADSIPIKSVWRVKQLSCNGFVAHELSRSPDAAEILRTGVVRIPNLSMEFYVPRTADIPVTSLRLAFDDRGRKVVDHYVLFSLNDLEDPIAAVMVTELPASVDTPQMAFRAAAAAENGNLQGTAAQPKLERVDTAWGQGFDLFVSNRIGSPCFPAARYRLAPEGQQTMGLSRFITMPGRLIQFALSVKFPEETTIDKQMAHARRVMDIFASGLKNP